MVCTTVVAAADPRTTTRVVEAEETYQLRLERVMKQKGLPAMVEFLAKEMKENPRPYVKAWYANYLIYGEEFGLKGVANPSRGYFLARESAEEGALFGLELMGRAWGDGKGAPYRDPVKAVEYLRKAVDQGRNSAMSELSKFYFFGAGVPKDWNEAERWAREAAYRGASAGMMQMAGWLENPQYAGTPDPAKALALYYEVGELCSSEARAIVRERAKKGEQLAQKYAYLGFIRVAKEGGSQLPAKLREAVKWLEANAAKDDLPVQLALADVMMEKMLVVYDLTAAKEKLARAAAAGSDDARTMQAEMTWRGLGQKADERAAAEQWRELAARGNARALNWMGWLHWWGEGQKYGVEKDAQKAYDMCRRAAELGHWAAQKNLADCYAHGIGVEVNYFLAAKYYGILEDRGYLSAAKMKNRILALVKD